MRKWFEFYFYYQFYLLTNQHQKLMKKLLLFALLAMLGMPVLAQDFEEEDVTKYIANAGFDEDLTFQKDGSMKEIASKNTSLSERSWAYIATDGSVYAKPKETSSQQRKDGRSKLDATNGFIGQVKGWTIDNLKDPLPNCEWVYFGTIPYDLGTDAIPIADDGDTYLLVPERPEAASGEDNVGFAYLRAGWGGRAVYRQVVNLPCAQYRLEYWAINTNPKATNGTNLSKVTCRKDVWEDETGFNDTEWTKHEIEFTPTTDFTIEFGFESEGGSGGNPFLCIDAIKLIKIGEADEVDLLQSDCWDYLTELEILQGDLTDYAGLSQELSDVIFNLQDAASSDDVETLRKALEDIKAALEKYTAIKDDVTALEDLITQAEQLAQDTDYPGKAELMKAIADAQDVLDNGGADAIIKGAADLRKAMSAYYFSQEGSIDNPADYSFIIQNPWFVAKSGEPTKNADGTYYFPGVEYAENAYVTGQAPSDGTSDGWYKCGTFTGGDQRLNFQQGRTCWNAWGNPIVGTVGIAQDIADLPNGLYKVQADLITQPGYCTDQHTFAKTLFGEKASPALTHDTWIEGGDGEWETLLTDGYAIVTDGKLTIGAMGTGTGESPAGWFLATNFKLFYCGPATEEQIAEAVAAHEAAVKEKVGQMHFAADKAAADALVAKYAETKDLATLNEAAALAEASEAKYTEIMAPGKTIPTVEAGLADGTYGTAAPIAKFALDYLKAYIEGPEATYEKVDSVLTVAKNYTDVYLPVYQEADELMQTSRSKLVTLILEPRLVAHVRLLTSEMKDAETVNEYVKELKDLMLLATKQEIYEAGGSDYTSFIQNPMAEAQDGWTLEYSDGPIKSGQWYTGEESVRYFDSWNPTAGELSFYGEQVVTGLPNGTYTIGVDTRTSGEGAFVFGAGKEDKSDLKWLEIPLQTYTHFDDETGEEVTDNATDKWGQIWEDACARYDTMTESDPDYFYLMGIVNANGGQGRGWEHLDIEEVVVKDHTLVLGMAVNAGDAPKAFTGTWFSVNNWTLTLINEGDNSDWDGPLADGISEVTTTKAIDGIYTINGIRTAKLQKGLNIVVRNGKAMKVLVK